jgi:predicted site-specific integrase-resolvase
MKSEYKYLTITQAANKSARCNNVVRRWLEEGRIKGVINPAKGIRLIPSDFEIPEPMKPHQRSHEKYSDITSFR